MKSINCEISDEAYKILSNYKTDRGFKKLQDALNELLIKMKGGEKI